MAATSLAGICLSCPSALTANPDAPRSTTWTAIGCPDLVVRVALTWPKAMPVNEILAIENARHGLLHHDRYSFQLTGQPPRGGVALFYK